MKPSLENLRASVKHKTKTKEYAVWNEYEIDEHGTRHLCSVCMSELKNYALVPYLKLEDSNEVELLYIIEAATSEEASAIRDLRLYGTPYVPQGKSVDCPTCGEFQVFPDSSNECPKCGCQDA